QRVIRVDDDIRKFIAGWILAAIGVVAGIWADVLFVDRHILHIDQLVVQKRRIGYAIHLVVRLHGGVRRLIGVDYRLWNLIVAIVDADEAGRRQACFSGGVQIVELTRAWRAG